MNTVWAILFLVKSTAKTIQKIKIRSGSAPGRSWAAESFPRT